MGYFSQQLNCESERTVFCNPRIWRLEDLAYRLRQLVESRAPYYSSIRLSKEDLKYSVPESLMTIHDVERAIDIQKEILLQSVHDREYTSPEVEEVFARVNTLFESESPGKSVIREERVAA